QLILFSKYLWIAFFFVFAGVFVASERFRLLLEAQGISISRFSSLELYLVGTFFNFVVPGGMGGDIIKAYYLHKSHGQEFKTVPYTVIFDRFIGLYVLVLLAFFSAILDFRTFLDNNELQPLGIFIALLSLTMSLGMFLSLNRSVREFLLKLPLGPSRPIFS